jgi:hypothetical protein
VRNIPRPPAAAVPLALLLALSPIGPRGARAQTTEIVECAKDPTSEACLAIPGGTQAPPPQWSAGVAAGVAPRDGGPTGTYEALSLHRQLGHSYVQVGAVHYNTALDTGEAAVTSNYGVGTLGFGGNYNNWVLDTYVSYGRQTFGAIRYPGGSRPSTDITSSPYWGGGISFGRMLPVSSRLVLTPTASVSYAWSRLLRPGDYYTADFNTSEPTWTGAGRLRLDWLPGHSRKSYVGLSVGVLWSNNATSLIGGAGGWTGTGGAGAGNGETSTGTLTTDHVHDAWVEVGPHASLALTRSLRIEATASRTFGLISGNGTTVGLGLRRAF